jgi:phosphoglycerate dehydrogenase-like enzyme
MASVPIVAKFFDQVQAALESQGLPLTRLRSLEEFTDPETPFETADLLVVAGNLPLNAAVLARCKSARAILVPTTGVEGIDVDAASGLGIIVGNGQFPENFESMAEATVMLMLVSTYDLHSSENLLRTNGPRPADPFARMLKRKTIGLIGLGQIARAVVKRLEAWDVDIIASVRRIPPDMPENVKIVPIEELLVQSDITVVLATLNDQTRGMLNYEKLKTTKPESILICVARGGIIVEPDLARLVLEGHFAKVALDVFEQEPLPSDSPLRALPRTIATPHMVGHTKESFALFPKVCLQSIHNVLSGHPPVYVKNPEITDRWTEKWKGKSLL